MRKLVLAIEVPERVRVGLDELFVPFCDGEPYMVEAAARNQRPRALLPVFTDLASLIFAKEAGLIEMETIHRVEDVGGFVRDMPDGVRLVVNPRRAGDGTVRCLCGIDNATPVFLSTDVN
jgi:hypothetical protein